MISCLIRADFNFALAFFAYFLKQEKLNSIIVNLVICLFIKANRSLSSKCSLRYSLCNYWYQSMVQNWWLPADMADNLSHARLCLRHFHSIIHYQNHRPHLVLRPQRLAIKVKSLIKQNEPKVKNWSID